MQYDPTTSTKTCSRCREPLPTDAFHRDASQPDGFKNDCKACRLAWRIANPDKPSVNSYKDWRKKNPERTAATSRAYREKNKDRITERERAYRDAHREHIAATGKMWRENNRDRRDQARRRWQETNPERVRDIVLIANHKRRTDNGSFTADEWKALCLKYGNQCLCCGRTGILLSVDHVVPISAGGSNSISNLQPLCRKCNSRKKNKTIDYRPPEQLSLL
jgi:5-methylcytosine-specific restriction endonuclease McrA